VLLAIDEGRVAMGAGTVYAPPLVGLVVGVGLGEWLGARAGLPVDVVALVLGALGVGLGAALARWLGDRAGNEGPYQPVLTRRLPN
jgi:positive regulator of sigma E activity